MRRLELTYGVTNLSKRYQEATVQWDDAEFTAGRDFTAVLRLWDNGIEPEQVWESKKRLQEKAESLRMGLRYMGNYATVFDKEARMVYRYDDLTFMPRTKDDVSAMADRLRGRMEVCKTNDFVSCGSRPEVAEFSPLMAPPTTMPFIPPDFHWVAESIVAADALSRHAELAMKVMRLAYLVLEEIEPSPPEVYRFVRDFVTHPTCADEAVRKFVTSELPSAVVAGGVQFQRRDKEHAAFVSRYASQALSRARGLFNERVKAEGGFVG